MYDPLKTTDEFDEWLEGLRDRTASSHIGARLRRLSAGNPGQHQGGICELKVDCGPGYRVYYREHPGAYVLLLCGGTKGSQQRDIRKARILAAQLE